MALPASRRRTVDTSKDTQFNDAWVVLAIVLALIGLALAKWVIEEQGGSIDLKSCTDPGSNGTCVTLRLPRRHDMEGKAHDHPDRGG